MNLKKIKLIVILFLALSIFTSCGDKEVEETSTNNLFVNLDYNDIND